MKMGDFQDRRQNLLRDSIRYHWLLVIAITLCVTALALIVGFLRPATYTSSTSILDTQIAGNPYTTESNSDTLEMLQTEAVAVTSQEVVSAVVDRLGIDIAPERLRQQTVVDVPPNTQALRITYTSVEKALPTRIVNAVAEEYLAQRELQAQEAIQSQVENLTGQLEESRRALRIANNTNDPNASAIRATIIDIQGRISTANAASTDPGRVLIPGSTASGSRSGHLLTFGIAGLIFGLLVGLATAVWRERRLDYIRSLDDLDDYPFDAPVTAVQSDGLDADSLRHLRMRLAPQIRENATIGLVGSTPGQALSTGMLLGQTLVADGVSVILIDGTGSEPGHRDLMGLQNVPGLGNALLDNEPASSVSVSDGFGYVPAGTAVQPASDHLIDEQARTIVRDVAQGYDLTLVACLPLGNIEGELMAKLCTGVILLVELGATSHFELGTAMRAVSNQGQRLLGVFVLPHQQ